MSDVSNPQTAGDIAAKIEALRQAQPDAFPAMPQGVAMTLGWNAAISEAVAAALAVSPAVTGREELAAEVERRLLCRMTGNYADGFEYAKRAAIEVIRDVRVSEPPAVTGEDERAVTMEGDFGIGSSRWPGLAKLAEESGELVQVLMKIVSMGGVENYNHWDGTDLLARLIEELGDVRAAMIFLCEANGISKDAVHARADLKLERFRYWHQAQLAAAAPSPAVTAPTDEPGVWVEAPDDMSYRDAVEWRPVPAVVAAQPDEETFETVISESAVREMARILNRHLGPWLPNDLPVVAGADLLMQAAKDSLSLPRFAGASRDDAREVLAQQIEALAQGPEASDWTTAMAWNDAIAAAAGVVRAALAVSPQGDPE